MTRALALTSALFGLIAAGCAALTGIEPPPAAVDPRPAADAATIAAAVADETRPEDNRARDENRRPDAILAFSQIGPGDAVIDLEPGGGYYTRMLSSVVGPEGRVHAVTSTLVQERFPQTLESISAIVASSDNVTTEVAAFDELALDRQYDSAFLILFYHDTVWIPYDREEMNSRIYDSIVPGGTLIVIDHHAPAGSGLREANTTHRIDAATVLEEIEAAGFVLEAESDALSHPEDNRTLNVFEPSIRGRTDRFVYRFRRPDR